VNDAPIGIFDSGMGGLTVLRALRAKLPAESFVYLGDTARLPYGTKSPDTVTRYAIQAASALARREVKLIVVACNTVSAVALPALSAAMGGTPVVGVIEPGAEAAVAAANGRPIAVIATEGTVNGGAYMRAIRARAPDCDVVQQACPLFVALAEEGLIAGDIAESVAAHYLAPLFARSEPGALVLGCTHFPVLAPTIAKVAASFGASPVLVDSAVTTADAVARLLADHGLARESPRHECDIYLATDSPERFARVGDIFLGSPPHPVELIELRANNASSQSSFRV
jgi:glutamate racemase